MKPSILEQAILTREAQIIPDLAACPIFNPEIDGMEDLAINAVVCAPMVVDNQIIGAVEVLYSSSGQISYYYQNMLATIVATLGFSIVNMRHIQQLRVANADVEANRWEIIRSRNILRALFDSLPTSIYIIDQSFTIVAINYSRAKRIADEPTQIVGKTCYEALYGRKRKPAPSPTDQIRSTASAPPASAEFGLKTSRWNGKLDLRRFERQQPARAGHHHRARCHRKAQAGS